eukprot:757537-Hanusia_phi.AAC.6
MTRRVSRAPVRPGVRACRQSGPQCSRLGADRESDPVVAAAARGAAPGAAPRYRPEPHRVTVSHPRPGDPNTRPVSGGPGPPLGS